jgi:cytosine/adenosine deaminase-related metal-dependent hydrolase
MSSSILLQGGTLLLHQPDDSVQAAPNTDLLITGDRIAAIGNDINPPSDAEIVDCHGKIITPGFTDTHHHLWQTQLKGRHADQELMAYMSHGNSMSYAYSPSDMFYGQLSGALEALDSGTTFVLDHAHGAYSTTHAQRAMDATLASGIRSILALAPILRFDRWDHKSVTANQDIMPDYVMAKIREWGTAAGTKGIRNRVHVGLGFDFFFLPEATVQSIWADAIAANARLITSHILRNALFGFNSTIQLLHSYGLLKSPQQGGITWLASHCTGVSRDDMALLAAAGQYCSTTPETEAQMALGSLWTFEPGVKTSLGIDCHTNNSASILMQARAALQLKRAETNARVLEKGAAPVKLRGSAVEAFNLATIEGARAVGMSDEFGSLAVGKKADVVVFDAARSVAMLCAPECDPLVAVLRHSDARDVEMVIVDGIVRKRDGRLLDVELDGGEKLSWSEVASRTRDSQRDVLKKINEVSPEVAERFLKQMWQVDESKLFGVD